jgi:hypothetical protein
MPPGGDAGAALTAEYIEDELRSIQSGRLRGFILIDMGVE